MDRFVKKFIVIMGILIVLGVFLFTSGMVEIASAKGQAPDVPSDVKLDVEIYGGINEEGNPINANPGDTTTFTFHITWINLTTDASGNVLYKETYDLGYFTANQSNMGEFPMVNGTPYGPKRNPDSWCIPFTEVCLFYTYTESYYHIDHYQIPAGYCPEYPDGQDRRSQGRSEAVFKYYTGSQCGNSGDWSNGPCAPHKCYILIQ